MTKKSVGIQFSLGSEVADVDDQYFFWHANGTIKLPH